MAMSVSTTKHLKTIGLLNIDDEDPGTIIVLTYVANSVFEIAEIFTLLFDMQM